jgi:excisionase family DNA binding protein
LIKNMGDEITNKENDASLVRVKRAAAMLGVSPRTVWRMIADQQLKAVHVRRCTCVLASELKQFFQGGNNVGCL